MKIKIIKTRYDCEYRDHMGSFQSRPKYICQHRDVSERNKINSKYWYEFPILDNMSSRAKLEIPDWCPLEDYKGL